jgi:hypothetical protein
MLSCNRALACGSCCCGAQLPRWSSSASPPLQLQHQRSCRGDLCNATPPCLPAPCRPAGEHAHRIWDAIYSQSCFSTINCEEKRVFQRLVSGIHTSISAHLSYDYLLDEVTATRRRLHCCGPGLGSAPACGCGTCLLGSCWAWHAAEEVAEAAAPVHLSVHLDVRCMKRHPLIQLVPFGARGQRWAPGRAVSAGPRRAARRAAGQRP